MVDWSGSDRRRAGKEGCIWIAHGVGAAEEPTTASPPWRTEAAELIRAQLQAIVVENNARLLLCDFGYG